MRTFARRLSFFENPTLARTMALCLALVAGLGGVVASYAQAVLTEAEVIRLVRTSTPLTDVTAAGRARVKAQGLAAGLWRNPTLTWSRETVESGRPTGSQDIVTAALPLDWARPRAAQAQAQAGALLDLAEMVGRGEQMVLKVLILYHAAVWADQERRLAAQALEVLDEVSRVLAQRLEAGTASGYEVQRLAIERELRRGALAQAHADAEAARAALAVWLGRPGDALQLPHTLSLLPDASVQALLLRPGDRHPVALQFAEATTQAQLAGERSALSWLPTLELVGGVKRVSDLGGGYGYVLGVALDLPLLDHGQGLRAEAQAAVALAKAQQAQFRRSSEAQLQQWRAEYRVCRQELGRFEAATGGPARALLQAAQSAYREGEQSIVELLDAYRAQAEVAKQRLLLLRRAKRAEVQLRAATGDLQ